MSNSPVLTEGPDCLADALPDGDVAGDGIASDPVLAKLRLRNLMREASYGDPRAQWDLGAEAMRRIVGRER